MSDLVRAYDVPHEEREYLWYPYLTQRNVNIFGGKTGTGKTWVLCAIMSAISRGQAPPGMPGRIDHGGNVLYFGNEDGNAEIKRRLETVRADTRRIYLSDDPFGLDDAGFSRLEGYVKEFQPASIFIDPITDFLPRGCDINTQTGVREITRPLRKMARAYDTMISFVCHPPKGNAYNLIDRFSGSGALVDSVREATFIGYHPTDPRKRVLLQPKNNINATKPAIYTLDQSSGFEWSGLDPSITEKAVADAERITDADVMDSELLRMVGLLTEVVKIHPEGIDMKSSDLLEEVQRLDAGFQMAPNAFGKRLQDYQLKMMLDDAGIALQIGSKAKNIQRYQLYNRGQISVLP